MITGDRRVQFNIMARTEAWSSMLRAPFAPGSLPESIVLRPFSQYQHGHRQGSTRKISVHSDKWSGAKAAKYRILETLMVSQDLRKIPISYYTMCRTICLAGDPKYWSVA